MDSAYAGSGLPAYDGGADYTQMPVVAFYRGHELWDREAGGVVRTITKVEMVARLHFVPMAGQPDSRDFPQFGPDSRQFGRKPPAPLPAEDLERSWQQADERARHAG